MRTRAKIILSIIILALMGDSINPNKVFTQDFKSTCKIPKELTLTRPPPLNEPTQILIGIYILDIIEINDAKQTFKSNFIHNLTWKDTRLSADALGHSLAGCEISVHEIWNPEINFINQQNLKNMLDEVVKVDSAGNIFYRQIFMGWLTTRINLIKFPFDSQVLPIKMGSFYSTEDLTLIVNEKRVGRFKEFSLLTWAIDLKKLIISSEQIAAQNRSVPIFTVELIAKRHPGFYYWKLFIPLGFIVFMAGSVFMIHPNQFGPQLGVSTASIFTMITFNYSLGNILPKISYLTLAGIYISFSGLLVFLAFGESIITGRLASKGHIEMAQTIDKWARVVYPVLFLSLVIYIFLNK
jgi:hypothetical protein